jgi:NAD(P)-dependent dehydrogenase (short-subunit alcohol dehydrogenase family)
MDLDGSIVIANGAASCFGRTLAHRLARAGGRVVIAWTRSRRTRRRTRANEIRIPGSDNLFSGHGQSGGGVRNGVEALLEFTSAKTCTSRK